MLPLANRAHLCFYGRKKTKYSDYFLVKFDCDCDFMGSKLFSFSFQFGSLSFSQLFIFVFLGVSSFFDIFVQRFLSTNCRVLDSSDLRAGHERTQTCGAGIRVDEQPSTAPTHHAPSQPINNNNNNQSNQTAAKANVRTSRRKNFSSFFFFKN